jgi:hypothetical protein
MRRNRRRNRRRTRVQPTADQYVLVQRLYDEEREKTVQ